MPKQDDIKNKGAAKGAHIDQWPGVDSVFRLIIVAAKRAKQLRRGAIPRIAIESKNQRHTYTALEEVKQGKVRFWTTDSNHSESEASPVAPDDVNMKNLEESWLA